MGGVMGGLWQRKGSKSHNDEADGRIKDKGSGYPRLFVDGRLDVATIRRFLIHETEGTLFYDEDGDVADEFYEEVKLDGGRRRALRRITQNLRPQGRVRLRIPRLPADFPLVMCQM